MINDLMNKVKMLITLDDDGNPSTEYDKCLIHIRNVINNDPVLGIMLEAMFKFSQFRDDTKYVCQIVDAYFEMGKISEDEARVLIMLLNN